MRETKIEIWWDGRGGGVEDLELSKILGFYVMNNDKASVWEAVEREWSDVRREQTED